MYLGTPGRMVQLKCPVAQRHTADEAYRFVTTLEGRRKGQVVPGQRRVWDISTGAVTTPTQVATLREFASGAWGPGPFWFIPEAAALVNVMSPHDTMHAGSSPGGPMRLDDGTWAPNSQSSVNGGQIFWRQLGIDSDPPVIPGQVMTGSAYVEGDGGHVVLQFFDRDYEPISSDRSPLGTSILDGIRLSVTSTAPANAAYVRLSVRSASRAARPAITWTKDLREWGEGAGCPKAVVSQADTSLTRAVPSAVVLSTVTFTVIEVG